MGLPEALEKISKTRVDSDGNKLQLYIFESTPQDPVVVFVPGTGCYAMAYASFIMSLCQEGFNVISFDPRGHGLSEGMRGSYDINELVRDTQAVISYAIEQYGKNVVVSGHSQGGMTAFYTAAADNRVKAAVCSNFHDASEPDTTRLTRFPRFYKSVLPMAPLTVKLLPTHIKIPVMSYLDTRGEPMPFFGSVQKFYDQDMLAVQ